MKLSEIFDPVYPTRLTDVEQDVDQYINDLSRARIKKLGAGAYAHVLAHPRYRNVVVKVHRMDFHRSPEDDGYIQYLMRAQKYPDNPYFPQLVDIRFFRNRKENLGKWETHPMYAITFMEKLSPKPANPKRWEASPIFEIFDDLYIQGPYDLKYFIDAALKIGDRNLAQAFKVIDSVREDGFGTLDIHEQNVMWRGNQPVFTDPIA